VTLKTAQRGRIPPVLVMDVMRAAHERAAAGADVLHLEVGQPSSGAPAKVVAAAQAALASGAALGYTDALGIPELREAISRPYRNF
jgi:aspartate/methionine/tyrosine aminotransferase